MFHHPLLLNELVSHLSRLKTQTVRGSKLLSIHRLTQSIFEDATSIVERVVRFDTLGTTFIPRIFEAKDWANLFGNFEDPMEELVRKFFSNAKYIGVKLKY